MANPDPLDDFIAASARTLGLPMKAGLVAGGES